MESVPIGFTVGSRRLAEVRRRLVRLSWELQDLLSGRDPAIPPLPPAADGYRLLSVPQARIEAVEHALSGFAIERRHSYPRYFIDMAGGFEHYLGSFSGKTRSTLARKSRRLEAAAGGVLDVRAYRTPSEIAGFLDLAGPLSERTYQERLLGAGLPRDAASRAEAAALAGADRLRAFLLFINGRPASYLWLTARNGVLRYDYLGYDPAFADLSPGTVLQMEALRRLFAEATFSHFDFTEGAGAHKRLFATGSIECASLLALRPTPSNRLLLWSAGSFDRAVAAAATLADRAGVASAAKRMLRA